MQPDYSFYNLRAYKLTLSLSVSVFLMLFMLVFQPFGVNNYSPTRIFSFEFLGLLVLIMVLTLIVSLFNEFVLRKWVFTQVTLPRIIAWSLWSFCLIGSAVFLFYNFLGEWHDFYLSSALEFILDLSSVCIFPTVGTFFYFRFQNLNKAYQQVLSNKQNSVEIDSMVHFRGNGVNDSIMISIQDFIYAKAQDNYVELVYRNHGSLAKSLIRTSLSDLSDSLKSPMLTRCHRSYLINLYHVRAITDGTDMRLFLNYVDLPLPVSKSYREAVNNAILEVKNFD